MLLYHDNVGVSIRIWQDDLFRRSRKVKSGYAENARNRNGRKESRSGLPRTCSRVFFACLACLRVLGVTAFSFRAPIPTPSLPLKGRGRPRSGGLVTGGVCPSTLATSQKGRPACAALHRWLGFSALRPTTAMKLSSITTRQSRPFSNLVNFFVARLDPHIAAMNCFLGATPP